MPPVQSEPATLVPVNSPPPASSGSSSSDNSDSDSSSRASGSEDGPPPLLSHVAASPPAAEKGTYALPAAISLIQRVHNTAAIPLSVVQTSNRDPVLTTAILPHSEFIIMCTAM